MRPNRLWYLMLALYFTFLGGGSYYILLFPVRVAHHIIVTVLLGLWLWNRIRPRYKNNAAHGLPITHLNTPLYAAVGIWLLTAMTSMDPRVALESVWFLIIHVILFFIVVNLIGRGYQRMVMEILFFMAAIVLILTGIELASWFFGLGIVPGTSVGWITTGFIPGIRDLPRVALAMSISTLQAGYVAPMVIVIAGWAATSTRRDYKIVLWLMATLLFITLLLTKSRGGILAFCAAAGVWILLRLLQNEHVKRRISPRSLLAGSFAFAVIMLSVYLAITLPLGQGRSNDQRLDMYTSAIEMTASNPLTGVGPSMFGRAFRDFRDPLIAQDKLASAHNLYLNTAAETGILGVIAGLWLVKNFLQRVWQNWQQSTHKGHKKRVEFVFAALAGLSVHSLFDVFSTTPLVLLILTLVAYAITQPPHSRLNFQPRGQRIPAIFVFGLIILYGIAFIPIDGAQAYYMASLRAPSTEDALDLIQKAQSTDPFLNLYRLHEAFIMGRANNLDAAMGAYEEALRLEPTWAIGWVNLGALVESRGDYVSALTYYERAFMLDERNHIARFNWARLAEISQAASEAEIVNAYILSIIGGRTGQLPLSEYWYATPLRQRVIEQLLEEQNTEWQYRIYQVHAANKLESIVPVSPQDESDWWVVGDYALTVENDPRQAVEAFTRAIAIAPRSGDYYASRARAYLHFEPELAKLDLDRAQVLGTMFEYPNAIRARLADDMNEILHLKIDAIPLRIIPQEFAATLYNGRPAVFDILPQTQYPGPGGQSIEPWLDVAYTYLESGQVEEAENAFRFIVSQAPFNSEAREQLQSLLTR